MKKILIILVILLAGASLGYTQNTHINLKKGVAIQGYDPISYFDGFPQKGDKEINATHKGAIYYFSTVENKAKFLNNPFAFQPEYGGWCAYAMGANGDKVKINPETYKIINGKLYLFYNAFFNNTLDSWNEDEENLKKKADQNWNKLIKS